MSFWETAGKIVGTVGKSVANSVSNYSAEYSSSRDSYGDRYSRMSDSQLKQEYKNLKENTPHMNAYQSGRVSALAAELKSRGYGN